MRQRMRKKWLKKHGQYIAPKELWNLDYTVAKFILPRLIKFKENSSGFLAMMKRILWISGKIFYRR